MKILILFFVSLMSMLPSMAQLKTTAVCPPFEVDVLAGNVNKVSSPKSTLGEVKKAFPCPAEIVEETVSATKCAGVFFKDLGIYFYTDRNYIEIAENFKGKLTPALMGADRSSLFKLLGYPKLKDISWEAFSTEYGTLVVYYDKAGKINKLQISNKNTESLKLCE
ncbi:MAG: hypothetical protein ABI741_06540 [Ferruginibacter sp.]